MNILLAPDVYVNASVAGAGLAPTQVVNRVLGNKQSRSKTTEWVLARVHAMLEAHPVFKKDAIEPQLKLIRDLVEIVKTKGDFKPEQWREALVAAAKAANVTRVVTDHPDLADQDPIDGIEFISSDAWMIEATTPPPPPPPGKKADPKAPPKGAAPAKGAPGKSAPAKSTAKKK
ncbi:MAG: hypothetical protein IT378_13390 [Sandaracinaceae bacterium]|nr:hypothetical protein [Sandaracinaceae bacterium]